MTARTAMPIATASRKIAATAALAFSFFALTACSENGATEDGSAAGSDQKDGAGGSVAGSGGQGAGATAAGGQGAGGTSTGGQDVPAGLVPVFVALGDGLQTIMSCDDGKTWVNNRFQTTELTGSNWGHDATSVRDLAYGDGVFVAASGWGSSGTALLRSTNGVDWETTFDPGQASFWSGTYGDGHFFFFEREPAISSDRGLTWSEPERLEDSEGQSLNLGKHGRVGFGEHSQHGQRWVTFGADDRSRVAQISYSPDAAVWTLATRSPATDACLKNPNNFGPVFGNDAFIIASNSNTLTAEDSPACISTDGGATWEPVSESFHPEKGSTGRVRNVLFHDGQFYAFTNGADVYTSSDGLSWTLRPSSSVPSARGMAGNPETGAWAAVSGSSFYRSDDGLTWTQLEPSAIDGAEKTEAEGGLFQFGSLVFGYAEPTDSCPL